MAAKSANLYARVEPDVKERAEEILAALGIPASNAINMFYRQVILQQGLPFDVKIPRRHALDVSRLSEEALNRELEKGYADIEAGRTRPAREVFAELRREYGLCCIALNSRRKQRRICVRFMSISHLNSEP